VSNENPTKIRFQRYFSLPAGVFQPYSGVKTSILILDKELNQKSDNIFFAKVENDGSSLGAQRTPIWHYQLGKN
jgi:type I restriction-modification system DNA methylase subunit